MNKLKRTLSLVATLAISATAVVGCGDIIFFRRKQQQ